MTAVLGWAVRTRAPREPAGNVSLESWGPPTIGVVSTQGTTRTADRQRAAAGREEPGRPRGRAPVSTRSCGRRRQGPGLSRAAAPASEVSSQLTGRKRAAGLRAAPTPEPSRGRFGSRPQPQLGPDFAPLTRNAAPRARSIRATAAAAPVNNTPHPLRTGTSGVRHLTSGGAGRGVGHTKCVLPWLALRPTWVHSKGVTTVSGARVYGEGLGKRSERWSEGNRATVGRCGGVPLLFISHRWYGPCAEWPPPSRGLPTREGLGGGAACGLYHLEGGVGQGQTVQA